MVGRGIDFDIDVLVLLPGQVDHALEERVFDAAHDVELKHGVVFGVVVYEKAFWDSGTDVDLLRDEAGLRRLRAPGTRRRAPRP